MPSQTGVLYTREVHEASGPMTTRVAQGHLAGSLLAAVLLGSPAGPSDSIRTVTVVGTDYAFAVPPILRHGPTAFTFENHGRVRHEMNLAALKQGITLDSVLHADLGPARRALVEGGGLLLAEPGERSPYQLLADLTAGRTYILVCTLRDAPDKPPHTQLGMFASFEVR